MLVSNLNTVQLKDLMRLVFIAFLTIPALLLAQEKKSFKDVVEINGYIKYLPSVSFVSNDATFDHLVHNRINTKVYISNNFTAKVDVRNRMFFGETVSAVPNYGDLVSFDPGEVDLSFLIVDENEFVLHTITDRAYLDYTNGKLEVRAGRQRINWGINLAWNANDLFNAYNIVDFDYEERPGSDALRLQYYTGDASSLDLAYKFGEDLDQSVIGGLYKFNLWKYDFQLLAANYYTDFATGFGWAGNLKNAGFKGESTVFTPKDDKEGDVVLSASTSVDYSFKNGVYVNGSILFNSNGEDELNPANQSFLSGALSAKNLMPTKYSFLSQVSGAFNPRLSGSMTFIYGQGMNILFIMPSLGYSLGNNSELSLTGQSYFAETVSSFSNAGNSIFLRFKYSF